MLESFRNVEGGVARPILVAGCLRQLGVEDVHFRMYFAVFVGAALLDGQYWLGRGGLKGEACVKRQRHLFHVVFEPVAPESLSKSNQ